MLEFSIVRYTQRSSQREMTNQPTWRAGILNVLGDRANGQGGEAMCLQNMCNRTDRARAQRSDRSQHHHINLIVLQEFCGLRARIEPDAGHAFVLIASEGQMPRRHAADHTLGG